MLQARGQMGHEQVESRLYKITLCLVPPALLAFVMSLALAKLIVAAALRSVRVLHQFCAQFDDRARDKELK